ncbi:hypothetical protein HDU76_007800, partial [Blyttiomyces sp. JEL0837]
MASSISTSSAGSSNLVQIQIELKSVGNKLRIFRESLGFIVIPTGISVPCANPYCSNDGHFDAESHAKEFCNEACGNSYRSVFKHYKDNLQPSFTIFNSHYKQCLAQWRTEMPENPTPADSIKWALESQTVKSDKTVHPFFIKFLSQILDNIESILPPVQTYRAPTPPINILQYLIRWQDKPDLILPKFSIEEDNKVKGKAVQRKGSDKEIEKQKRRLSDSEADTEKIQESQEVSEPKRPKISTTSSQLLESSKASTSGNNSKLILQTLNSVLQSQQQSLLPLPLSQQQSLFQVPLPPKISELKLSNQSIPAVETKLSTLSPFNPSVAAILSNLQSLK